MTIRRLFDNLRYIGLSTDTKPILHMEEDESIVTGAEFYEMDTGDTYLWDGHGWGKKKSPRPVYSIRLENTNAPPTKITYIGEALPGSLDSDPVWRIKKITETDHVGFDPDIEVEWCNGNDDFVNLWNGHAGFSYS